MNKHQKRWHEAKTDKEVYNATRLLLIAARAHMLKTYPQIESEIRAAFGHPVINYCCVRGLPTIPESRLVASILKWEF